MTGNNETFSGNVASATGTPTPPRPDTHMLDVVWSSPISTGTGWGYALRAQAEALDNTALQDDAQSWPSRHIVAFESDLLDNAFVHWDQERPTLEMIAGFKKEASPEISGQPVESLMSGPANLVEATYPAITALPADASLIDDGTRPFQPDTSAGVAGPATVRKDGIEDPLTGWRPTGLVFFETLSTPPRGIVYSSRMLNAFAENKDLNSEFGDVTHPDFDHVASSHIDSGTDNPPPFFDFPENVGAAPPEETEDFPLEPVVVKGGSGTGSGGTFLVRAFGRLVLISLALFGLAFFGVIAMYGIYAKQRLYDGSPNTGRSVVVTVTPGEGFRSIIDNMNKDGLLKSFMGLDDRYLMRYLAYFYEDSDKIKPGVYRFASGQDLNHVYRKLIEGSKDYKITIPEGKTAQEIGDLVAKQYQGFDAAYFNQLVNDPTFIKSLHVDAPSLEGYLYPSTYYFGPGMKEEELIKLMVSTFHKKMDTIQDKITTDSLSLQEHIIMASLIEREARMDEDRPLIASVMYNRLEKGMPLQIDATVNFALNNWRRLKNTDYQVDHPYNTYKFKGLPPGPITSPRIESILATYTAPKTNYFYYVHKGDGHHAFAETYAQHQANVGRYIRERNASTMGNVPSAAAIAAAGGTAAADKNNASGSTTEAGDIKVYLDSTGKAPSVAGDQSETTADEAEEINVSGSRETPESPGKDEAEEKREIKESPTPKPEMPAPDEDKPEEPAVNQDAPESPAPGEKTPAPKSY